MHYLASRNSITKHRRIALDHVQNSDLYMQVTAAWAIQQIQNCQFMAFIFDAFYMHLYHIYMMHFIQPIDEIKIKFKNM